MSDSHDSSRLASTAVGQRQAWRALGGLCLGTLVCFANTAAFNVALPAISISLGANEMAQQWMVSAYNLVFAASMLLSGTLGDRRGVKRTLILGTGIFTLASVVGSFAPNCEVTIAVRGLMGLGAGLYVPMALALIRRMFDADAQLRALTMRSVAITLGVPFGLIIGGLLVHLAEWRSIFVFDIVAFAIVTLLNVLLIPRDGSVSSGPSDAGRLPLLSALLALFGLSLLSAGLINAQTSPAAFGAWGLALVGVAVLALFAHYDLRSPNHLAELGLLRIPSFASASLSLLALNLAVSGIMFVLPPYVETALGNSALMGALMLMPMVSTTMAGAALVQPAARRLGKRCACVGSLAIIACGLTAMGVSTLAVGYYPLMAVGQCVCGLGMGVGFSTMQGWGMEQVPSERSGGGSALISTFQQIGCLLGVGCLGSLVGMTYASACAGSAAEGPATISMAFELAATQDVAQGQAIRAAATEAYAHAILVTFGVTAVAITLMAVAIAWWSGSGRLGREDHAGG